MATVSQELVPYSQGYVYMWIDMSNGMMYVGSTNGKRENYIGSGKRFKAAFRKRPESFVRIILYKGHYYYGIEHTILKALDAGNNSAFYNIMSWMWGPSTVDDEKRRIESTILSWSDERLKAEQSVRMRKMFQNDEIKKNHLAGCVRAWTDAESRRENARKKTTALWSNDEYRKAVMNGRSTTKARSAYSAAGKQGTHIRWHVDRRMFRITCKWCIADTDEWT